MPLANIFKVHKIKDSDSDLMLAFAGGDSAAFEKLYANYRIPLFQYFYQRLGKQEISEELYQELWIKVINAANSYQRKAKFSTWLYRIAHNLLVDYLRRSQPEIASVNTQESEDLDLSFAARAENEPDQELFRAEQLQRFRLSLADLSMVQRDVFLLKEEAGMSLDEIAAITGEGMETIKSRLRYAVKKLRLALQDEKHQQPLDETLSKGMVSES